MLELKYNIYSAKFTVYQATASSPVTAKITSTLFLQSFNSLSNFSHLIGYLDF